jgi:magnesium transporter
VHILFNTFLYLDKDVLINEENLFIGKNFIVTVTRAGINNPDFTRGNQALIEKEMRNAKLGPAYAMHVILDYIVDQKFTAIDAVGDDLANLEDIMTENHNAFDHALLQRIRQSLMALRKSLFHEREILVKICRNDIDIIPDKAIIHYNDIYDHITKFFELTEIYREMVTNLIQTNLAMLNNDIAKSANDTNLSVRRLTLITTIFMPLTLIAGVGGMSEWSMITGSGNWRVAYPVFLGIMMLIGAANYFILKWLERKD